MPGCELAQPFEAVPAELTRPPTRPEGGRAVDVEGVPMVGAGDHCRHRRDAPEPLADDQDVGKNAEMLGGEHPADAAMAARAAKLRDGRRRRRSPWQAVTEITDSGHS